MSGGSSPFIGRVTRKKGVTCRSSWLDPQVTRFLNLMHIHLLRVTLSDNDKIIIYNLTFDPQPTTKPDRSDGGVLAQYIYFVGIQPFTKVGTPRAHPWRSLFPYINTY